MPYQGPPGLPGEVASMPPVSTSTSANPSQDWRWRLAQQRFAVLLGDDSLPSAAATTAAADALSALSADARRALHRWLAMNLSGGDEQSVAVALRNLGRSNAALMRGVRAQLPQVSAELQARGAFAVAA